MKDTASRPATELPGFADETATTCVAALDSIIRLSQMGAATRAAAAQLRSLAELCSEANRVVGEIREDLARADGSEDPVRLADALERLHRMSAAVRAATDTADETIGQIAATRS